MENKSKLIDYLILLKLLIAKKNIYFPNNFYVWWVSYLLPVIDYRLYKNIGVDKYYRKMEFSSFINAYNIKYNLFKILNKKYKKIDNIYCEIFCDKIVNNRTDFLESIHFSKDLLNISSYDNICNLPKVVGVMKENIISFIKNFNNYDFNQDVCQKSPILYVDYKIEIKINFIRKNYFYFSEIIDTFTFEIPLLKKYNGTNKKINEYIYNYLFFLNSITCCSTRVFKKLLNSSEIMSNTGSDNSNNFLESEHFLRNKNEELIKFNIFNENLFNNFYPIINNDYIFSSPIKKLIYLDLYKKIINRN
jgi:hypothetical protein